MNVLNIIHLLLRKRFTSDAHFKQLEEINAWEETDTHFKQREEINAWEETLFVPALFVLKHLLLSTREFIVIDQRD